MAQVSLYLTDTARQHLRANAKRADTSISKYVSALVEETEDQASWPMGLWDAVYGALDDPSFVVPPEMEADLDGALPSFVRG